VPKPPRSEICNSNYFQIYFRSADPEEMFSNADLSRVLSDLNETTTEADAKKVFSTMLDSIPPGHPKREEFLTNRKGESLPLKRSCEFGNSLTGRLSIVTMLV
jgi:hypothetical protein